MNLRPWFTQGHSVSRRKVLFSCATVLLPLAAAIPFLAILRVEARYNITDLGPVRSRVNLDINNAGQALVSTWSPNSSRGPKTYIFEPDGGKTAVESPGGWELIAFGINHRGVTAGVLEGNRPGNSVPRSLWTKDKGFSVFPDPQSETRFLNGGSGGINDSETIVGSWTSQFRSSHSFIWNASGGFTEITDSIGGRNNALDINNAGDVVGWIRNSSRSRRAFLWNATEGTSLLEAGGVTMGSSAARALNDRGQVVGHYLRKRILAGIVRSLREMFETRYSRIGLSFPTQSRACLWEEGVLYDLNDFIPPDAGWELREAHGINDPGVIVGWGLLDKKKHAFMLTPTY